jgi:DNA repair protein RadC
MITKRHKVLYLRDRAGGPASEKKKYAPRDVDILMSLLDIGADIALDILNKSPLAGLAEADLSFLNKKKQDRLKAAISFCDRVREDKKTLRPILGCPEDAIRLLVDIRSQKKEHFVCIFANSRNQSIHQEVISIGSVNASIVHPREVFSAALSHSACAVLLAHNHPSNDPQPSHEDIELTHRLMKAGSIMGVDVLDHLIVCEDDYISLKEKGLM